MNRYEPDTGFTQIPDILFRGTEMMKLPEITSPVMIIVKTDAVSPEELDTLGKSLSEKETAKSQRFRFYRDRLSYVVVHGLSRRMLGSALRISPEKVGIAYNPFGKPLVSGYSGQFYFNQSHSSGVSVLAFDPSNEIGVDVERIDDEFEYLPIVQHFFTQEEKRYIRQSKAESRKRFYEIWTRKEAFLKAVGTGITENLGVDVLHEKMKGVAIRENGSTGKNLLLRSMLFEQDFMITLAMCADSGNLHKYIIGFGNNDLSRFGS